MFFNSLILATNRHRHNRGGERAILPFKRWRRDFSLSAKLGVYLVHRQTTQENHDPEGCCDERVVEAKAGYVIEPFFQTHSPNRRREWCDLLGRCCIAASTCCCDHQGALASTPGIDVELEGVTLRRWQRVLRRQNRWRRRRCW